MIKILYANLKVIHTFLNLNSLINIIELIYIICFKKLILAIYLKMHDYKIDLEEESSSAEDTCSETSDHVEYIEISDDSQFESELPTASYMSKDNKIQIPLPQVVELRYIIL